MIKDEKEELTLWAKTRVGVIYKGKESASKANWVKLHQLHSKQCKRVRLYKPFLIKYLICNLV